MNDLEQFRDHARRMAQLTAPALDQNPSGTCRFGHHGHCRRGPDRCPCACHDGTRTPTPTTGERALWTRLADEVDEYLAPDHTDHDEPLEFG